MCCVCACCVAITTSLAGLFPLRKFRPQSEGTSYVNRNKLPPVASQNQSNQHCITSSTKIYIFLNRDFLGCVFSRFYVAGEYSPPHFSIPAGGMGRCLYHAPQSIVPRSGLMITPNVVKLFKTGQVCVIVLTSSTDLI